MVDIKKNFAYIPTAIIGFLFLLILKSTNSGKPMKKDLLKSYFNVDKELLIILLLVVLAGFIYFFIINQRSFLNIFYLPVLLGAFFFGKRYAIISSLFSVLIICFVAYASPNSFNTSAIENTQLVKWIDIMTWGGFLILTGYCMGMLYERKEMARNELQKTYRGIIEMLSLIIESADNHTQSHSHRVSIMSEMIARKMKLSEFETENIRVAALLHDLGKIGVSENVLRKVEELTTQERSQIKKHTWYAVNMLEPLGDTLRDLLPIILHHHEKYDGTGYYKAAQEDIPLGARIIAVADVFDALTTDRPYRKAFSSLQARQEIMTNAGTHFDPNVVNAFCEVFPFVEGEYNVISSSTIQ
jgi:putative nucleotidyltransferase with HDIG domain